MCLKFLFTLYIFLFCYRVCSSLWPLVFGCIFNTTQHNISFWQRWLPNINTFFFSFFFGSLKSFNKRRKNVYICIFIVHTWKETSHYLHSMQFDIRLLWMHGRSWISQNFYHKFSSIFIFLFASFMFKHFLLLSFSFLPKN